MQNTTALVLSAGGLKTVAFVGALGELERQGVRPGMFGGTSGGSIFAALLGAGYTTAQLEELFLQIAREPVSRFRDIDYAGLIGILFGRWSASRGYMHGTRLEARMRLLLRAKGVGSVAEFVHPTFLLAVDLIDGRETLFTNVPSTVPGLGIASPDTDAAAAVRASISIPGLFAPRTIAGRPYIDGGVRSYLPVRAAHDLGAGRILTLLVRPNPPSRTRILSSGIFSITERAIDIMIDEQVENDASSIVTAGVRHATIALTIPQTPLFSVSAIPDLIESGRRAMRDFLKEHPAALDGFVGV